MTEISKNLLLKQLSRYDLDILSFSFFAFHSPIILLPHQQSEVNTSDRPNFGTFIGSVMKRAAQTVDHGKDAGPSARPEKIAETWEHAAGIMLLGGMDEDTRIEGRQHFHDPRDRQMQLAGGVSMHVGPPRNNERRFYANKLERPREVPTEPNSSLEFLGQFDGFDVSSSCMTCLASERLCPVN
jgi:hypothetical protein